MKTLSLLATLYLLPVYLFSQIIPLPNAHAHNDYEHERPLLDALEQGFTQIEIDVYPIEEDLYVYHDPQQHWEKHRSLSSLYLKPLDHWINQHEGQVFEGYEQPIYLMIDIKRSPELAYENILKAIEPYGDWIIHKEGDTWTKGLVRIFISGARPRKQILEDQSAWLALDGRPEDLGKGISSELMPVVSQNYWKLIQWKGDQKIKRKDRKKLKSLSSRVHKEGKKLRLWASPEKENVWQSLLKHGVDFINTDELEKASNWLRANS